jgi:hypothetical protein
MKMHQNELGFWECRLPINPMKHPSKLHEQALNDLSPRDRELIENIKDKLKWLKDN